VEDLTVLEDDDIEGDEEEGGDGKKSRLSRLKGIIVGAVGGGKGAGKGGQQQQQHPRGRGNGEDETVTLSFNEQYATSPLSEDSARLPHSPLPLQLRQQAILAGATKLTAKKGDWWIRNPMNASDQDSASPATGGSGNDSGNGGGGESSATGGGEGAGTSDARTHTQSNGAHSGANGHGNGNGKPDGPLVPAEFVFEQGSCEGVQSSGGKSVAAPGAATATATGTGTGTGSPETDSRSV
jgi:hypothetical protein